MLEKYLTNLAPITASLKEETDFTHKLNGKGELIEISIQGNQNEPVEMTEDEFYSIFNDYANLEVINISNIKIKYPSELETAIRLEIRLLKLCFISISFIERLIEVVFDSFSPLLTTIQLNNLFAFGTLTFRNQLPKISTLETYFSIDFKNRISNGVLKISGIEYLTTLQNLNLKNQDIKELDISRMPNLEKLFLDGNPHLIIQWPKEFTRLQILELGNNEIIDEVLLEFAKNTGEDLRTNVNKYLTRLSPKLNDSIKTIRRLKLIFIGNTTSGKSELRQNLTGKKDKKSESTHGVKIFFKKIKLENDLIYLSGYDFGGQDYYHTSHLPLYDLKDTLYILVWGNPSEQIMGLATNSDTFGLKIVDGREEFLYPLKYWLGSLIYKLNPIGDPIMYFEDKYRSHNLYHYSRTQKLAIENLKKGNLTFKEIEDIRKSVYTDFDDQKSVNVEIIQNLRKFTKEGYLNNKSLKELRKIDVGDICSFNFKEDPKKTRNWLIQRIKERVKPRQVLESEMTIGQFLVEQPKVVFTLMQLLEVPNIKTFYENLEAVEALAKRLQIRGFGFTYPNLIEEGIQVTQHYFIARIDIFSSWIHQILNKELIDKTNGYFTQEEAINRLEGEDAKTHVGLILDYLLKQNIIFEIPENIDKIKRFVAPSYLPTILNKSDELLIETFSSPECIFEFPEFFHSNIVLMIISRFEKNLVFDSLNKQYLMWKNIIILTLENEESKKTYLLIKLEYPNTKNSLELPRLIICRNYFGFVENSLFRNVFLFVKQELSTFQTKINLKTPLGNYIPYECLSQTNTIQNKTKSHLIFHKNTFYSIHDFRHYLDNFNSPPTKIFIAYSKADNLYREELSIHLKPYENQGDIIVYFDGNLDLGEKWDPELKNQIAQSDIMVCLVSPNMLATDYVIEEEIPLAHSLKKIIVPIVLIDCDWSFRKLNNGVNLLSANHIYAKTTPLPTDKNERATKWTEIAKNLKNKTNSTNGK
jgi:internalin A